MASRVGLPPARALVAGLGLVLVVLWAMASPAAAVEVSWPGVTSVPLLGEGVSPVSSAVAAVEVAGWRPGEAEYVVVAREDVMADALAAAPLLAGGPLLLVPQHGPVPDSVVGVIEDLGVGRVVVVGGPSAVAPSVVDQLRGEGLVVERLAGATRFATSVAVAQRLVGDGPAGTVVLASIKPPTSTLSLLMSSPDVYAAGSVAGRAGWPLLLTSPGVLPAETREFLAAAGVERVVVAGGEAAVSAGVEAAVAELVGTVERVGEVGRDGTAVALAGLAGAVGQAPAVVLVDGVLDAGQVAGALGVGISARRDLPVLLVNGDRDRGGVPEETAAVLAEPGGSTELVCVTTPGVCGQAWEVAVGQVVPEVVLDPPGGRVVAGQAIDVEVGGGGEGNVSGSCVAQAGLVAGQGQVMADDPLPAGGCSLVVESTSPAGPVRQRFGFNDPRVPLEGVRLAVSPEDPRAAVEMTLVAGDDVSVGWDAGELGQTCSRVTLTGPDGAVLGRHEHHACPDAVFAPPRLPPLRVAEEGVHTLTVELLDAAAAGGGVHVWAEVIGPPTEVEVDGPPVRIVAAGARQPAQVHFTAKAGDLIGIGLDRSTETDNTGRLTAEVASGTTPLTELDSTAQRITPGGVAELAPFQIPTDGAYTVVVQGTENQSVSTRLWVSRIAPPDASVDGPPVPLQALRPGVPLIARMQLQADQEITIGTPGPLGTRFCVSQIIDGRLYDPDACTPSVGPLPREDVRGRGTVPVSVRPSEAGEWFAFQRRFRQDALFGNPVDLYVNGVHPQVVQVGETVELRHDRPGQLTDLRVDATAGAMSPVRIDTGDMPGCWELALYDDLDSEPTLPLESWSEYWIPNGPSPSCSNATTFELRMPHYVDPPVSLRFHTFQETGAFSITPGG